MYYVRTFLWITLVIVAITMLVRSWERQFPDKDLSLDSPPYADSALLYTDWQAPDTAAIPATRAGTEIRYGLALITHTARYLGPKGSVAAITNGMDCGDCHRNAGTLLMGNNFSAVAATYPRVGERSGRLESIPWRINDCIQRHLNGQRLDSSGKEMRAMVAYLLWIGKDVPRGIRPRNAALPQLPYPDRAADTARGRVVYMDHCQVCHGGQGAGVKDNEGISYVYPPVWGANSYSIGGEFYRISRLAAYILYNMPPGDTAMLSAADSWDVAAYINAKPHPEKFFPHDWPDPLRKAIDYPYGPFADTFNARHHKYGPFKPIEAARKQRYR
ncbi:c-type cytochrome [Chitinophaga agrisoli]|nr:c-type cytochrome [Chitinophaga agrisoli]